jgi:hypothetical protein
MVKFEKITKDGKVKPYNCSQHEYKGYTMYRFYNNRPFKVVTPDGVELYFRKDNIKGYNKISFAEICRLIDNGTLNEFYGDPAKEKFFYNS